MSCRLSIIGALIVALAASLIPAAPAQAQASDILKQLPKEAPIAIVIPSLSKLSEKVAMLNQKLAINQPQMNDVLAFMKAMSGVMKGVDDDGGMAVVITKLPAAPPLAPPAGGAQPAQPPVMEEPSGIALLPVKNYNLFLANFGVQGAKPDDATPLQMQGEQVFARHVGKHVVIGVKKDEVLGYKPAGGKAIAERVGASGRTIIEKHDFYVYVDIQHIATLYRDTVKQAIAQMRQMFEQFGEQGPEMAVMQAYFTIYADVADAMLRDGDAFIEGVSIAETGILLSEVATFKKGSPLANDFGQAPAKAPSFNRLPSHQPFLVAMALDTSSLPVKRWYGNMLKAFDAKSPFGKMLADSKPLVDQASGRMSALFYPPKIDGEKPQWFRSISTADAKDPEAYRKAYGKQIKGMNGVSIGGMTYLTTYDADALKVGGVSVDRYSMKFKMPEELQNNPNFGPMGMFLQGYEGHLFSGNGAIAYTTGIDEKTLASAVAALPGKGKLDQDPGIVGARRFLPKNRIIEGYIEVGAILALVKNFMGEQAKFNAPKGMPPIAGAVALDDGAVEIRGHVPMAVIKAVKDAIMSTLQPNQGPGAPPVARAVN